MWLQIHTMVAHNIISNGMCVHVYLEGTHGPRYGCPCPTWNLRLHRSSTKQSGQLSQKSASFTMWMSWWMDCIPASPQVSLNGLDFGRRRSSIPWLCRSVEQHCANSSFLSSGLVLECSLLPCARSSKILLHQLKPRKAITSLSFRLMTHLQYFLN